MDKTERGRLKYMSPRLNICKYAILFMARSEGLDNFVWNEIG